MVAVLSLCLCRQWGLLTMPLTGEVGAYGYCTFPVSFNTNQYRVVSIHSGTNAAIVYQLNTEFDAQHCVLCSKMYDGSYTTAWNANWIAIGR